ncbi:hypothetical protein [Aureivirga sp. CE67]|uniref:hypothetical protein n=1 Tax=Aureivirga sp. CE67 TaxID=1788983 RepID=UPI0018CA5B52|nr:hypothetical protein [Aureivirga sp. CE67]
MLHTSEKNMKAKEFIEIIEKYSPNLPPKKILEKVDFIHNGKEDWSESDDLKSKFREKIVELIFDSERNNKREFINYLLKAEIE